MLKSSIVQPTTEEKKYLDLAKAKTINNLIKSTVEHVNLLSEEDFATRMDLADNIINMKETLRSLTGEKHLHEWFASVKDSDFNLKIDRYGNRYTCLDIPDDSKVQIGDTIYLYIDYIEEGYLKYKMTISKVKDGKAEVFVVDSYGKNISYGELRLCIKPEYVEKPVLIRGKLRIFLETRLELV